MSLRLLLATRNPHKAAEIGRMLRDLPLRVATLEEFPAVGEVVEDGRTLEENAAKKAALPARETGLWTLADDTGLEVAALDGAPGVRSARYAGDGCDYADNNAKLLRALRGAAPDRRRAAFRCVMALAGPDGRVTLEEGRLEGSIALGPRGRNGFGYDPLFFVPASGKTFAEMSDEEKDSVSHRRLALTRMRAHLARLCGTAAVPTASGRRSSVCPRCDRVMDAWHCRELCPECGFQIDCSDL